MERGFTLIEVAIAIVVIALLLGGLLGPLSVRIEQADRKKTQELLDGIKEALYGFAAANGRLPCPDTNDDGEENRTLGNECFDTPFSSGNLPSVDLGVASTDAWGRPFAYGVTASFADDDPDNGGGCISTSPTTSIALCSVANICVKGSAAAGTCNVGTNIPAVIVSYGANEGLALTSPDETENRPPHNIDFVSRGYSQNPGSEFDDLVAWISPHILMNRMIAAGLLP